MKTVLNTILTICWYAQCSTRSHQNYNCDKYCNSEENCKKKKRWENLLNIIVLWT